jgi:bacteriocin biosynthesis cyclodehydratase domain-containing protein
VVVLSALGDSVFGGAEYAAVVTAIGDGRSAAEVLDAAGGDDAVAQALAELTAAGVVVEASEGLPPEHAAWWAQQRTPPAKAATGLEASTVSVLAVGRVDPAPVAAALEEVGVRVETGGQHLVVLTDDYLRDELAARNEDALESGAPWLLAAPARSEVWVGPLFAPDRGACWECLAQRLRRARRVDRFVRDVPGRSEPIVRTAGSTPSTRQVGAGMVATEVLRWIVSGEAASPLANRLVSLDTRTWQSDIHDLTWRPQCRACGAPDASLDRPAAPVELAREGSAPASEELRTASPETTVERFVHHVSPITGVVPVLVRPTGVRPPLHAYVAGEPGPDIRGDRRWAPGVSTPAGGKGATDAQAKASALCEALERYSGEFTGEESRRRGSLEELRPVAIHPNEVMGFSETQYAARQETNADATSSRKFVPERLDPAAQIDWTPLWSLSAQQERLLPTSFCYYEAQVEGREVCPPDSNGNAAGNTLEEAMLQGLLELVERDHVALWWYNRLRLPGVDLDSLGDPWLVAARSRLEADGLELWALDLTADLGIPVAAALAAPRDGEGRVVMGFGAHVDLPLATRRAVTELVQIRTYAPSGGLGHGTDAKLDLSEDSYLRASGLSSSEDGTVDRAPLDVRATLVDYVARFEARGMEVMVLDQTRPDIGLPVVKVVVPGMRHFWPRLAPGRLYDVPVALGRLSERLSESDLNPIPPVE